VEFIADAGASDSGGNFFFMEMNTRLQVEHPVTEMISGQDLVAWQLAVASGDPLPVGQDGLDIHGHAVEARVYAEDAANDFLPSIGRIAEMRTPESSPYVRIDSGVRTGDAITVHYDPMIAKLIVWDETRGDALRRLRAALARFHVVGPTTNLPFLQTLAAHPAFAQADLDTGFIEKHRASLLPEPQPAPDHVLATAALAELLGIADAAAERAAASGDPHSPWHAVNGFVLNDDNHHVLHFRDGTREAAVTVHFRRDHYALDLPGGTVRATASWAAPGDRGEIRVDLDGVRRSAGVVRDGQRIAVMSEGGRHDLTLYDPLLAGMADEIKEGSLKAPMPGTVTQVMVDEGDTVAEGDPLMILEAMKMEHTITATKPGVIETLAYAAGDSVAEGAELLAIADAGDKAA
jgi:3-methylcrotonyl-CoA carboxylase alpha subunit